MNQQDPDTAVQAHAPAVDAAAVESGVARSARILGFLLKYRNAGVFGGLDMADAAADPGAEPAIAGKPEESKSGFWYSAPFTEALLVGLLAMRFQKRIEWDSAAMTAKNCPEADAIIRKAYRDGWKLPA